MILKYLPKQIVKTQESFVSLIKAQGMSTPVLINHDNCVLDYWANNQVFSAALEAGIKFKVSYVD